MIRKMRETIDDTNEIKIWQQWECFLQQWKLLLVTLAT